MTKCTPLAFGPLVLLCGSLAGCGHRADPLPPLRKTPPAPMAFRLAQRGEQLELLATAPAASVDGLAYQALAVEFLHGGEKIDLEKKGTRVMVPAAAGAAASTTLPLPRPGTQVRAAARAVVRGERGPRTLTSMLVTHMPLEPPTQLTARLTENGIELRWRGPRPAPIAPPPLPTLPFVSRLLAGTPGFSAPGAAAAGATALPGANTPAPAASGAEAPVSGSSSQPGASVPPAAKPPAEPAAGAATPSAPPEATATKSAPAPAATTPQPPRPVVPGAAAGTPGVTVTTPPPPPLRRNGFFVYRRTGQEPYRAALQTEPTDRHALLDPSAPEGAQVCYVVRAVGSPEPLIESGASNEVCLARLDVLAPDPPAGLAALPKPGAIELLWSPSKEEDLAAYRVYRAEGGDPQRLVELSPGKAAWLDEGVKPGISYRYTLTAVDRAGNESTPSEPVEAALP